MIVSDRNIFRVPVIAPLLFTIAFSWLFCATCFAASSANYNITPEVIDLGGQSSMDSSSYMMFGKLRENSPVSSTSSSYTLEGRFTGIVAVSATVTGEPVLTSIIPNKGTNDRAYRVIINGSNISVDATAQLTKTGQTPIIGYQVSIETTVSLECTFALTGEAVGLWSVVVTNTGFGKSGVLTNGFTVSSTGPVKLIGTPSNNPNPFNPSTQPTTITYDLSSAADIQLYLFNQRGDIVWQKHFSAGENGGMAGVNTINWNGISDYSENVPTGVYILRIVTRSGGARELGKIKIAILRQ